MLCNHSSKPKEYIEKFESDSLNKKQKELRKGHQEIYFGNYSKRIKSSGDIQNFG